MRTTSIFRKKTLALAISAVSASTMSVAIAEENGARLMEEVIVTATSRKQSVQDIPYNISAMSGDDIESRNIVNQNDLLRAIHGISVVDRGYRNGGMVNSIVIRGLNVDNGANGDIQLNAVPTVATYVDNTPLFANFILKDIERVEVLRGPQGTLYGSGSLGGTVRYISRKPDTSGVEGSVTLDYGQTNGSDGNNLHMVGVVNVPLSDRAAVRAHVGRIDNDGVIDYVNAYQLNGFREPLIDAGGSCIDPRNATDQQVLLNTACFGEVEDADDVEIDYGKIAVMFEPTDNASILLTYQRQEDATGARRAVTKGDNGQPAGSPLYFEYGDDDSGMVLLEPSERELELTSLDVEWDLGFATFTSNTSVYEHEGVGESDNGGLWASGGNDWNFAFYGGQWPRPAQRAERGYEDEATIQEFRLVSNETKNGFDWLVGAYYMDQDSYVYQLSHNPGMNLFKNACRNTGDPLCTVGGIYGGFWPRFYSGDLTEIDFEYVRETDYEEKAIYGELTYHVSDTFRLTGGFRWFDNDTVNNVKLGFPLPPGATSPSAPQSTDADDDVLFKLNASWDVSEDMMVYGTYSEGYRHGGAQSLPSADNGDPFGEPNAEAMRTFGSDSVQNYELGVKGSGNSFTYSASLFHVDWKDPQLNTVSAWYGFYLADNGDEASTQGIELEVEGVLGESLHYRVGYTYLNAELEEDFYDTQTGGLMEVSGADLPLSPDHLLSVGLNNTWQVGDGWELTGGISGSYQSETHNFLIKDSKWDDEFDSFWIWNASLRLEAEKWYGVLYVNNAGDEEAVTGSFPCTYFCFDNGTFENWYGNGNRQMIAAPRTVGLTFGYRFR
jgi:outer membrane receptor protein involved in Fe transport